MNTVKHPFGLLPMYEFTVVFSSYRVFFCIQKVKSNITLRKIITKLSSSCWRRVPTLIEKITKNSLLLAQLVKYALLLFWFLNKFVEINLQIKNSEDTWSLSRCWSRKAPKSIDSTRSLFTRLVVYDRLLLVKVVASLTFFIFFSLNVLFWIYS